jgi:uncharacterized coiled-coil protein SlyX
MERVQSKIAYLEQAVAEISDVVFRQHREIQSLEAIRERLAGTPSEEPRTGELERPPHY